MDALKLTANILFLLQITLLNVTSLSAQSIPRRSLVTNHAKLPLSFEKNVGQTDSRVHFLSRGQGYSLFLTPKEAVFSLKTEPQKQASVLRMQLVGANPSAPETAQSKISGTTNYLIGNDKSRWRAGVENFGRVGFAEVYKGVDVVYYGNQSQLEYDFIVKPHANPSEIRLKFAGAKRLKMLSDGGLLLETEQGSLRWHTPVAYQETKGVRHTVVAKYALQKGEEVCFKVGNYDTSCPLVIDPVLTYSSSFGGHGLDTVTALAVDSEGNTYIAGYTSSKDFPTTTGTLQTENKGGKIGNDVFITKLNSEGTALLYSTYLGGTGDDWAYGIAVDSKGSAYVAGQTVSKDYPVTSGAFQTFQLGGKLGLNGFVTKLAPDGKSLLYSTYLGGSEDDFLYGIALDGDGNAYLVGYTASLNFPTTPKAFQPKPNQTPSTLYDAFVTKLSADGKSLVYSTYLGGSGKHSGDYGLAVTVDSGGSAYVVGYTGSEDFPVTPGAYQTKFVGTALDGFITKLNAEGSALAYSTYLGGSNYDFVNTIAVDQDGNAYVAGSTRSKNFPVTSNAFQTQYKSGDLGGNAFVAKLSADGRTLLYSTYLGGTGKFNSDAAGSIAVDRKGSAYVAGRTGSVDFPVTAGALQTKSRGLDGFITQLSPDGDSLLYSTFLGGKSEDWAAALALDSVGNIYVTGTTWSLDFPITEGAFHTSLTEAHQVYVTKFGVPIPQTLSVAGSPFVQEGGKILCTALLNTTVEADTNVDIVAQGNVAVSLPSQVTIPKGKDRVSFEVTYGSVTNDTKTSISITLNKRSASQDITVYKKRTVKSISLAGKPALYANGTLKFRVLLNRAVGANQLVSLKLQGSGATISPTSTLNIPPNAEGADVILTADSTILADAQVTLTGSLNQSTRSKAAWLLQPRLLTKFTAPDTIVGGKSDTGTLSITPNAKVLPVTVSLTSNSKSLLQVPASQVFYDGVGSLNFTITTAAVKKNTVVRITAKLGSTTLTKDITVTP